MTAGALNRRIAVQSKADTQDDYGQPQEIWEDLLQCWASIRTVTSKEVYAASGFTSQLTHKITIRFPPIEIHSGMRVLFRERVFQIQAVSDQDQSRTELDLFCLELNEGK